MELPPPEWPPSWPHGPEPIAPIQYPARPRPDQLGPTEDVDREPDGVPHAVVGATAGFSVVLAVLISALFFVSHGPTRAIASLLILFAVPVIMTSLKHKADRDRNRQHPSR
jgi:hypothetical protein